MDWRIAAIGVVCSFALGFHSSGSSAQEPAPPRFDEPIPIPSNGPAGAAPTAPPASTPPTFPAPLPQAIPTPASPPIATTVPLPAANSRLIQIEPRNSQGYNIRYLDAPNGQQLAIITGGIKMLATFLQGDKVTILYVQADELVVWMRGGKIREFVGSSTPQEASGEREVEFYMAGNVILRYGNPTEKRNPDGTPVEEKTIRADKVYYDASRNKAVAINGELQFTRPGIRDPAVVKAKEIWQLSPSEYRAFNTSLSASGLPSDPGLSLAMNQMDIEQNKQIRRSIFGVAFTNRQTDEELTTTETLFTGEGSTLRLLDTPIFYVPYLSGNINKPLGPLEGITFRQDKVYGSQILATFSVLELLGMTPLPGERWDLLADYLSQRGPALGTTYENRGDKFFGYDMPFQTQFKAYGIYDHGHDVLGGIRENDFVPSQLRGRISLRQQLEVSENLTFQGQVAYLSDRNFLESYYKQDFDFGPNMETFAHLKYQEGNGAATLLAQSNLSRDWVTQTNWLPKADGYWLGQSFLDTFTYNAWGSAGYANLQTAKVQVVPAYTGPNLQFAPFPYERTDVNSSAGRFDVMQEISMPFQAGPVKLVPYAKVDLAYYTNDIPGQDVGRAYGGAGLRASMPLSRLYSDVQSDLFNLNGLNHKVTLGANYFTAYSNVSYTKLPQFDRLNDDATDQALRDIHPYQYLYVPGPKGLALTYSPLYDPQLYAIRRLVDTNPDTLSSIQILQLDLNQRWQTKRGYPGMEHTVDWLTLDLSASLFPTADRDNFGKAASFLEYDANWYVGDRTGITSSGWFDPYSNGVSYWSIGAFLTRPDRTNFSVSYRQFDLVNSKALTASVNYIFSQKYAITASTTYDFGLNKSLSNSLVFSRTGTDLTVNFGLNYNAILNNFGLQFEVVPNLLATRTAGRGLFAPTPSGGLGR